MQGSYFIAKYIMVLFLEGETDIFYEVLWTIGPA